MAHKKKQPAVAPGGGKEGHTTDSGSSNPENAGATSTPVGIRSSKRRRTPTERAGGGKKTEGASDSPKQPLPKKKAGKKKKKERKEKKKPHARAFQIARVLLLYHHLCSPRISPSVFVFSISTPVSGEKCAYMYGHHSPHLPYSPLLSPSLFPPLLCLLLLRRVHSPEHVRFQARHFHQSLHKGIVLDILVLIHISSLGQHQLQLFGIDDLGEEGIDRGKRKALGEQVLKDSRDEGRVVPNFVGLVDAPVFKCI